ncbi:hypothetical protein, partial [Escherichia coli]|uniref:hypothetical protein n=1 Tax=Escherichia coli TaxID=562 RepID=UPI000BDF9942
SLKTSIKTITYLSDTGCLEIQGASLEIADGFTKTGVLLWFLLSRMGDVCYSYLSLEFKLK